MSKPYKMKGFSGFGNSPIKQRGENWWKYKAGFGGDPTWSKTQDASNMMGTEWQEGETTGQEYGGSGNLTGSGSNAKLIQALKKQDEAEVEIKNIGESKSGSPNSRINL